MHGWSMAPPTPPPPRSQRQPPERSAHGCQTRWPGRSGCGVELRVSSVCGRRRRAAAVEEGGRRRTTSFTPPHRRDNHRQRKRASAVSATDPVTRAMGDLPCKGPRRRSAISHDVLLLPLPLLSLSLTPHTFPRLRVWSTARGAEAERCGGCRHHTRTRVHRGPRARGSALPAAPPSLLPHSRHGGRRR